MKSKSMFPRRILALLLAVVTLLPLAGPAAVTDVSAVTQAEIDALKGNASALAQQKKEL